MVEYEDAGWYPPTNEQSPVWIGDDTSSNSRLSIVIFVFASVNVRNDADTIFMICVILLWKFRTVMMMTLSEKWKQMTKWRCRWSVGKHCNITMTIFCLPGSKGVTNKLDAFWIYYATAGNQPMVLVLVVGLSICFPPLLDQSPPETNPLSLEDSDKPPAFTTNCWQTNMVDWKHAPFWRCNSYGAWGFSRACLTELY